MPITYTASSDLYLPNAEVGAPNLTRDTSVSKREHNIRSYIGKIGWIYLAQEGPGTGICEHGNETSGSIKERRGEFFD
jgi:hypothetical protein